jgi:simple sugar transport system ATP-binding protein
VTASPPLDPSDPRSANALVMRAVRKAFGRVVAVDGVDLTVRPGEIHALLGENGAGKSTLMHLAAGVMAPDSGAMSLHDVDGFPGSPRIAAERGVAMVHQHFTTIDALTVAENIALGTRWPVRPDLLRARVLDLLAALGLPLDPDATAGELSVGLRQRLEIAKALASGPRLLLLDEPTSVLAPAEAAEMFRSLRTFVAAGGSAVLITHRLHEALEEADVVTVLRQGRTALAGARVGELDRAQLLAAMLGDSSVGVEPHQGGGSVGPVAVSITDLSVEREGRGGLAVRGATLEVRSGEIVVVAAVEGNGQRELLRAIAGVVPAVAGTRTIRGPVAFIPEDRTTEALIGEFTLTENLVLSDLATPGGAWLDRRDARARVERLIRAYDVKAAGPAALAQSLSGGNQQKFVNGRALDIGPAVLVAENPTRGLDVRAAAAVHRQIRQAADGGAAVLMHCPDLEEALAVADRIVVMADGRLREVPPGADLRLIGELMLAPEAEMAR